MAKHKNPTGLMKGVDDFLDNNPDIKKALRMFEISNSQYEAAIEGQVCFFTSDSTQDRGNFLTTSRAK